MEPRLEIACRLLSSLICQDRNRSLDTRREEVRHALALADLLIQEASTNQPPATTHATKAGSQSQLTSEQEILTRAAMARFHDHVQRQRSDPPSSGGRTLH